MRPGTVFSVTGFTIKNGTTEAKFKMPKGEEAVIVFLGNVPQGTDYNLQMMLKRLGWVPDKKGKKEHDNEA